MFKSSVIQTPFTSEAANACFTNITGGSFGQDVSFLATLRALLAPRMQEGERISLYFCSSALTSSNVSANSVERVLSLICGGYDLGDANQIIIHTFRADQASNMACFKVIESKFASVYGYHRLEKIKAFYRKSFEVDCYINPSLKSVIVFVDSMDNKKLHYLQAAMLAMLPWYFDPEKGLTEDEQALVYSLRETSPDKYNECLAKMAERYDFKTARIRQLLSGFETKYERLECDATRARITRIDSQIRQYNRAITEQLRQREEECIRLLGLETKIASGEEDDSEIMEYFIRNPNLVLNSVSDSRLSFCAKGYLEYFDSEMADRAIRNRNSFVYAYGLAEREANHDKVARLMSEIFLNDDPRLRIRFCAAYQFDLRGSVDARDHYEFDSEFDGYMPNTHINEYACMGGYVTAINELLQRRDYISALEQCIASCKSLDWGDHTVMCKFMRLFLDSRRGYKCIELPDGRVVDAATAIDWLEEQDKPVDTQAQSVEETKEETPNE